MGISDYDRDSSNAKACEVPMQRGETLEHRLARSASSAVIAALHAEGLVLIEADSPRSLWHKALRDAQASERGGDVAALIDCGARNGWIS